jgi:hypothetical protein
MAARRFRPGQPDLFGTPPPLARPVGPSSVDWRTLDGVLSLAPWLVEVSRRVAGPVVVCAVCWKDDQPTEIDAAVRHVAVRARHVHPGAPALSAVVSLPSPGLVRVSATPLAQDVLRHQVFVCRLCAITDHYAGYDDVSASVRQKHADCEKGLPSRP